MSAIGAIGASEEAISIKTAVLECWPEVNGLTAVHAIKRGEISYAYSLTGADCEASNSGPWVNDDIKQGAHDHDDNLVWHVERRHGKRLLHLNQHLAVTAEQQQQQHYTDDDALEQGKEIPATDQQRQSIWIRWKGDCRMVSYLPRFVAMHKPCGIITTMSQCEGENGASSTLPSSEENDDDGSHDEGIAAGSALNVNFEAAGISNVYDLLRSCLPNAQSSQHLRAIGRLDKNTEGLLLFTTRGGWIRALSSPTPPHCPKRYRCTLQHAATQDDLNMWTSGTLQFRDRKCAHGLATAQAALEAVFVDGDDNEYKSHCVVDVTIVEGRYRQVRRCWEALGNRVVRLQRLSMGPIELSLETATTSSTPSTTTTATTGAMKMSPSPLFLLDIPIGECRELTPHQVAALLPWVRT